MHTWPTRACLQVELLTRDVSLYKARIEELEKDFMKVGACVGGGEGGPCGSERFARFATLAYPGHCS